MESGFQVSCTTESAMGKKANVYSVAFKMCEAQVIV